MEPGFGLELAVVLAGAFALALLWRAGCLRRAALDEAPLRDSGLHLIDLPVVVVLMALGAWAAFGLLDFVLGGPPALGAVSTLQHAGAVLTYQALAQGLPVGYVLVRVAAARGGLAGMRALGLHARRGLWQLRLAGLALLAGLPMLLALGIVVGWLATLLDWWVPQIGHDLLLALQQADSVAGLIALVVAVVVVAAVFEEVLYRGLVQSALLHALGPQWRWTTVMIAAALFTFMHIGLGTFDPDGEGGVTWNALPTLLALAVILGWLYERTDSLWPPILVHAGFNAFNVALVMLLHP